MTYKPTGQKIYFRGLDDTLKLTSITVEKGYLCWAWIEEAYQSGYSIIFVMIESAVVLLFLLARLPLHTRYRP